MDSSKRAEALVNLLVGTVSGELVTWVHDAAAAAKSAQPESIATPYAAAARKLRGVRIEASPESLPVLVSLGLAEFATGPADRVLRVALLLIACCGLPPRDHGALVMRMFQTGDTDERIAVLKAIALLSDPGSCVATAVEACRSNVSEVFEAIACENEYPARWFSDDAFNQMVMKAVFSGVALARIRGLAERVNPELSRMAEDYASERRAAGRPVPADLALVVGGGGRP